LRLSAKLASDEKALGRYLTAVKAATATSAKTIIIPIIIRMSRPFWLVGAAVVVGGTKGPGRLFSIGKRYYKPVEKSMKSSDCYAKGKNHQLY
jgi:hypothetical protein